MNIVKLVGVVADDITGANDIGVMFANNGLRAIVVSLDDQPTAQDFTQADVLIINTGSRLLMADEAAEKSALAARLLMGFGCDMIYTKTCSVFRGNIGATFDAVQDAAGVSCSMVVLGFPKNGRTTIGGIHYVYGKKLEETAFANDPVHPMNCSCLTRIIGRQSKRRCENFIAAFLDLPLEEQKAHLTELKKKAGYIVFDVRCQDDLAIISRLIAKEKNICGASALCEELPKAWGNAGPAQKCRSFVLKDKPRGLVIFAGSMTPATTAQTERLCALKTPFFELEPAKLLKNETCSDHLEQAREFLCREIRQGHDALIMTSRKNVDCAAAGVTPAAAGRKISEGFACLAAAVHHETGANRYLTLGGETSDAVRGALGIRAMRIYEEIDVGVPLMIGKCASGEEMLLVFKSGSFGSDDFLVRAIHKLNTLCGETI